MDGFTKKLIGRLEEHKTKAYVAGITSNPYQFGACNAMDSAIKIINQLAEEQKDKIMIDGQYCWQTCSATEHCKECNRLCSGSIDYYENYDVIAEEYINSSTNTSSDYCEWKLLIKLPCKVGDTLYLPYSRPRYIKEVIVTDFMFNGCDLHILTDFVTLGNRDIGKTVFLTKEAAEQALSKMKGV